MKTSILRLIPFASIAIALAACSASVDGGDDSTSEAARTAQSCKAADDCTGFLPKIEYTCADGSHSGAEWSCVKNKCAITHCTSQPPADNSCKTAKDCKGPTPKIEFICPDGSESGEEWSCVKNQCELTHCQ